jgi:hypothetical protein
MLGRKRGTAQISDVFACGVISVVVFENTTTLIAP